MVAAESLNLFEVEFVRDVRIPTSDPSLTLGADLHLPVGAGPAPLLLLALPYRKDSGGADLLHRYFACRGYACMTLDLLGTGSSDGEPRVPFASDDAQDALDAIAWGAEQSWCDGNVGMWGHSYGGMMTMRTASRRPAALKAIIPVQGFLDPEGDFVHPDHARGAVGPAAWITGMIENLVVPPMHAPDDEEALTRWRKRLDCADEHVLDLFRNPPGAVTWQSRVIDASLIDVPALCFTGWRDLFADAQTRGFEAMTGPKRLIAGPWMHVLPVVADEGSLDFLGICIAWWDRWLKGIDNGADAEPSAYFVQGPVPYWTALDGWPAQRSSASTFPAGDAAVIPLTLTSSAESSDPTRGLLSGLTRIPTAGVGMPADQHDDDLKSTCWTSEPLGTPLTIVGRVEVTLESPVSDRLVVKLTHVDPAGRSVLITSGAVGEGASAAVDRLLLDATAYEIPAGHRLRVVLTDADLPRLWPRRGSAAPTPAVRELSIPTLQKSEAHPVELPAQPAHLTALVESMRSEQGVNSTWTVERDLLMGGLTMAMGSTASGGEHPQVDSSNRTVAAVSPIGSTQVTTLSSRIIRWSGHPVQTVEVETTLTGEKFTAVARVYDGDELVVDKSWSADVPVAEPRQDG